MRFGGWVRVSTYVDESDVGFGFGIREWALGDGIVHAVADGKTMTGPLI